MGLFYPPGSGGGGGGTTSWPSGTVNAPGWPNTTNTNDGLYEVAAGTIGIATGGLDNTRFVGVASAVNYLSLTNSATGNNPVLAVAGSDTNVGLQINAKGTGPINFATNGGINLSAGTGANLAVAISNPASAVNYLSLTGGATGNAPLISAIGGDGNIGLALSTKGNSQMLFYAGGALSLSLANPSSSVNNITLTGSATATAVSIAATGSDTNISLNLISKGTGTVQVNGVPISTTRQAFLQIGGPGGSAPVNGTYYISPGWPQANTIISAYAYTIGAGTATVAIQIGGVSVTGLSALAATTVSTSTTAATGANTLAAGNTVTAVITSATSFVTGNQLLIAINYQ